MIDLALDNNIILNTDIECAVQELDILFNTERTELLGYTTYGMNITPYLWTLTPATDSLRTHIENTISEHTYYARIFNPVVNVRYIYGSAETIYIVSITLTDDSGVATTRNYKLQ